MLTDYMRYPQLTDLVLVSMYGHSCMTRQSTRPGSYDYIDTCMTNHQCVELHKGGQRVTNFYN